MKTLRQHIRKLNKTQFIELRNMCSYSNSLYNCCITSIKEHYNQTGKYIGLNPLYYFIKTTTYYNLLPAKIALQIVRLSDKNYRAFFALLKKKQNGQYGGIIHEPQLRKENDLFNLILPNDQINLIHGKLKITKNIRIPFSYNINGEIRQAIIKPKLKGKYYELHLTYIPNEIKNINDSSNNKSKNLLSIDLGINNFVSCFSNIGRSFIVNGKPLKSYNQYYNKRKSLIQTELKIKNNKKWSNKLERLTINRQNYIDNYINQTVNIIKKFCIRNDIDEVICGYNDGWKQNVNMKKVNNQSFMSIPHYLFKQKLENKLNEIGCKFTSQEESYTSKCSFLDNEEIKKHDLYSGKRIKRGLFRTKNGKLINADVNGAANIMRKNVGLKVKFNLTNKLVGCIVSPLKLKNIFLIQKINELL